MCCWKLHKEDKAVNERTVMLIRVSERPDLHVRKACGKSVADACHWSGKPFSTKFQDRYPDPLGVVTVYRPTTFPASSVTETKHGMYTSIQDL